MMKLIKAVSRWLRHLREDLSVLIDRLDPNGQVELRLIHASGPKKGQVAKVVHGHNVITNWQSIGGAAPTSGRDLIRRKIVPVGFSGSLASDDDATVSKVQLGSGTTAEQSSDTALVTPIVDSKKDISSVEYDASHTYVTFIVIYDETEVNETLSEACLLSARTPEDFLSRKTFGSFSKTNEYLLEVRWTYRL